MVALGNADHTVAYANLSWDCNISQLVTPSCSSWKVWHTGILEKRVPENPAKPILFEKSACDITFTVLGDTPFSHTTETAASKGKMRDIWRMQAGIETHIYIYVHVKWKTSPMRAGIPPPNLEYWLIYPKHLEQSLAHTCWINDMIENDCSKFMSEKILFLSPTLCSWILRSKQSHGKYQHIN